MKKNIVRKGLVVGIIALFIGLVFIPSFNAVSISKDIEKTNPIVDNSEEDCIECQSNVKPHLAEKLLNKLEKSEVLSKDIKLFEEFNSGLSDRPICNMLEDLYKDYLIKAVIYLDKALDPYELLILTVVYLSMSMVYAYLSSVILMIYKSIGCNESYYIDD